MSWHVWCCCWFPFQDPTTGLDNSTELRTEKISQAVTEIWVPQLRQLPVRPPARTVTTIPLQPGGLRGKKLGHPLSWLVIGDGNSTSAYNDPKCLTGSLTAITRHSENDNTPLPLIRERIAHSWAKRLETVRVSHWPITWPIYLPCTVAQEQAHCASNIVSDSHLFHSKSVDLPTSMAIKNLTLKIQGQGHGWGQSLKSQLGSNILSTHILLSPCQSTLLLLW